MQIPIDELRNLVKITDLPLLRELCDNCKKSYDNDTRFIISFSDSLDVDLSFITSVASTSGSSVPNWTLISIIRNCIWGISNNNLFDTIYETVEYLNEYSSCEIKVLDRREWITHLNKITSEL